MPVAVSAVNLAVDWVSVPIAVLLIPVAVVLKLPDVMSKLFAPSPMLDAFNPESVITPELPRIFIAPVELPILTPAPALVPILVEAVPVVLMLVMPVIDAPLAETVKPPEVDNAPTLLIVSCPLVPKDKLSLVLAGEIALVPLFLLQYPIVPLFDPVILPVQAKFPLAWVRVQPLFADPPARSIFPEVGYNTTPFAQVLAVALYCKTNASVAGLIVCPEAIVKVPDIEALLVIKSPVLEMLHPDVPVISLSVPVLAPVKLNCSPV
jgi:hypothetical protein